MCLIINQWVEIQDPTLSLKKLASFKHLIMALLNPKEVLNEDLAIKRCDQRIWFYDVVGLSISNVIREFAMYKGWKSCFLARDELHVCYLQQNSS